MASSISFPPSGSAVIETLDGSNWPTWLSRITALFRMNGLKNHITEEKPAVDPDKDWNTKQEIILGVLEMYCQKDVWTSVCDDSKFTSCKAKWDELKRIYGGSDLCPLSIPGLLSPAPPWMNLPQCYLSFRS